MVADRDLQVLQAVAELFVDDEGPKTVLPGEVDVPGLSEANVAAAFRRLVDRGLLIEDGFPSFSVAAAGVGIGGVTEQGRRVARG